MRSLIIFGATSFSEIANAYFSESGYKVTAHVVDEGFTPPGQHKIGESPIFEMSSLRGKQAISEATHFYVASTYTHLNRFRTTRFNLLKNMGLIPASYLSPNAFIDPSVSIGEHTFIFESNVLQYGVKVGSNCVLWSGNHIGHHTQIGNNVFISSHVVISGHVKIGDNCFLGVNSTIYNNIELGEDNWVSPGAIVKRTSENNTLFMVSGTQPNKIPTREFFKKQMETYDF